MMSKDKHPESALPPKNGQAEAIGWLLSVPSDAQSKALEKERLGLLSSGWARSPEPLNPHLLLPAWPRVWEGWGG